MIRAAGWLALATAGLVAPLEAQTAVGAQAVLGLTWAQRTPFGDGRAEVKVVQPVLMAHLVRGPAALDVTLNGEGLLMPGGELMPGVWGEGFNDRRHPHTAVHEVMLSLRAGPVSLSAGKGFVPFGTDDPMSRPALRFPVNHHLAQVLERAVVIGAARAGPLTAEAALFNGDEPERPGQAPNWSRLGDSWSARLTAEPLPGVELQVSTADVTSPEHRNGAGPEHRKWSASARLAREWRGRRLTALVEWARDSELEGTFRYRSALAEAEAAGPRGRWWVRLERTERPEEERLVDDRFRSTRPHHDNSILGITRWHTITVGAARAMRGPRGARFEPLAEVSWISLTNVVGVVQTPEALFGRTRFWSLSAGLRVALGAPMHRMGRYGVLASRTADHAALGHTP